MEPAPKIQQMISKSSDSSIDSESGIKLSEFATSIAENYNKYHQVSLQLESLQSWIKEQETLYNGSK